MPNPRFIQTAGRWKNEEVPAVAPTPITQKKPTTRKVDGMIYVPEINAYFAKERTYLNKNWNETHQLLAAENLRMPTIEEFRQTLRYFKTSSDRELKELYDEITQVKDPWRANWLDGYFEKRKKDWYFLTRNKTKEEKLEACLRNDKTPGISLDGWLGSESTSQGLPKANIAQGDLYYWHPRENSVARFLAYSGGAGLSCYRDPAYADPILGVFAVADAKP